MPKFDDFEKRTANTIVHEIPDARQVQASNNLGASYLDFGANSGLFNQQSQGSFSIFAYRPPCRGPVLCPPLCCSFDLALCARFDSDLKRQRLTETEKLGEELLGRNSIFSVRLVERGKKLCLFCG